MTKEGIKQISVRLSAERKAEFFKALLDEGVSFQKWFEREMEKFLIKKGKKEKAG